VKNRSQEPRLRKSLTDCIFGKSNLSGQQIYKFRPNFKNSVLPNPRTRTSPGREVCFSSVLVKPRNKPQPQNQTVSRNRIPHFWETHIPSRGRVKHIHRCPIGENKRRYNQSAYLNTARKATEHVGTFSSSASIFLLFPSAFELFFSDNLVASNETLIFEISALECLIRSKNGGRAARHCTRSVGTGFRPRRFI
jgi:hypothetical protein